MLDNDMIRLNMKLAMVLENKVIISSKLSAEQRAQLENLIDRYTDTTNDSFNTTGKP